MKDMKDIKKQALMELLAKSQMPKMLSHEDEDMLEECDDEHEMNGMDEEGKPVKMMIAANSPEELQKGLQKAPEVLDMAQEFMKKRLGALSEEKPLLKKKSSVMGIRG